MAGGKKNDAKAFPHLHFHCSYNTWGLICLQKTCSLCTHCAVHFRKKLKKTFLIAISVSVKELCAKSEKDNFLSNIPKPIDGAVVVSQNERDVDCVVTFQTESILEQFMIRFDDLKIDCNDKLVIYDGAHAIGKFMVSECYIECRFFLIRLKSHTLREF